MLRMPSTKQTKWNYKPKQPQPGRNNAPAGRGPPRPNQSDGSVFSGSGIRMRVMVCPKFSQVFLAFSTLLFFASVECLLFAIVTVTPGMMGRSFTPSQCKVINTVIHGNTTCYVDSFSNHGALRVFPCLQIYVIPVANEGQEDPSDRTKRNVLSDDTARMHSNGNDNLQVSVPTRNSEDLDDTLLRTKRFNQFSNNTTEGAVLMFQTELNYAGMDYLYRRCSYLPSHCDSDIRTIMTELCSFASDWVDFNSTFQCYHNEKDNRVILNRTINVGDMLHSILWPLLGLLISIFCCIGFWRRNHKRISRLYIYNSWSAS